MQSKNLRNELRVDEVISALESHLIPAPSSGTAKLRST